MLNLSKAVELKQRCGFKLKAGARYDLCLRKAQTLSFATLDRDTMNSSVIHPLMNVYFTREL